MQYTKDARIKALLCYLWPIGLVLFFVERNNSFVRYNAAQALVMLGLLIVMWLVRLIPLPFTGVIYWIIASAILLVSVIAAINCWNGNTFRIPLVADLADVLMKKL